MPSIDFALSLYFTAPSIVFTENSFLEYFFYCENFPSRINLNPLFRLHKGFNSENKYKMKVYYFTHVSYVICAARALSKLCKYARGINKVAILQSLQCAVVFICTYYLNYTTIAASK